MKLARQQHEVHLRVGQLLTLTIKSLGINGEGIGYYRKKIVFVDGALPGEVVRAEVTRVEKNYAAARLRSVLERSAQRVEPPCPLYHQCGGCSLQHLDYQAQLVSKQALVEEALRKYAGLAQPPVAETIGMEHPWNYRNKAQFQVGQKGGRLIAGLYKPGSHELVHLPECPIQHQETSKIVAKTREILEKLRIPAYDERRRSGVIRTIVARAAFATGEAQLTLVTAVPEIPRVDELIQELRRQLPALVSIVQNVNPHKTSLVFGEKTRTLWGKPSIVEKMGELSFDLSARAFFQLNPVQTVKLYDQVKQAARLTGRELVFDLYCGTGTIALWLAPFAKEVRGIEVIPEAVQDARRNARQNGIGNVSFYTGKAEELLPQWAKRGIKPDLVVVDPPRTGLAAVLIDALLEVRPQRIVYVSCNPSTLGKDAGRLLRAYELRHVQPLDMFPHTPHVEAIASLERKTGGR
jgi:23S rRNA (uracil-5-)-methyltransferase RumA